MCIWYNVLFFYLSCCAELQWMLWSPFKLGLLLISAMQHSPSSAAAFTQAFTYFDLHNPLFSFFRWETRPGINLFINLGGEDLEILPPPSLLPKFPCQYEVLLIIVWFFTHYVVVLEVLGCCFWIIASLVPRFPIFFNALMHLGSLGMRLQTPPPCMLVALDMLASEFNCPYLHIKFRVSYHFRVLVNIVSKWWVSFTFLAI